MKSSFLDNIDTCQTKTAFLQKCIFCFYFTIIVLIDFIFIVFYFFYYLIIIVYIAILVTVYGIMEVLQLCLQESTSQI